MSVVFELIELILLAAIYGIQIQVIYCICHIIPNPNLQDRRLSIYTIMQYSYVLVVEIFPYCTLLQYRLQISESTFEDCYTCHISTHVTDTKLNVRYSIPLNVAHLLTL